MHKRRISGEDHIDEEVPRKIGIKLEPRPSSSTDDKIRSESAACEENDNGEIDSSSFLRDCEDISSDDSLAGVPLRPDSVPQFDSDTPGSETELTDVDESLDGDLPLKYQKCPKRNTKQTRSKRRKQVANAENASTRDVREETKTCPFNYFDQENQKEFEEGITRMEEDKTSPGSNEEKSTMVRQLEDVDVDDSMNSQHEGDVKVREKSLSDDDFLSECDYEEKRDDLALSDLEQLLDADLPSKYKKPTAGSFLQRLNERRKNEGDFIEVEKTILDDISGDHFDLLPEGWMQMLHNIGIPVYLNRPTRVCTLARPYFLGSGNIYNHKIPLSAIPCMQYRQAMNKIEHTKLEDCTRVIRNLRVPITKVETVYDNHRNQSLEPDEVRQYCQKLFPYKKVVIKRNKNLKNKYNMNVVQSRNFKNRPSLPTGTKLLSFIIFERDGQGDVIRRREWIMNPSGKSYIAILHEYLQQSLKLQPVYEYKENDNEFEAIVKLKDEVYGKGVGSSKKDAKMLAAKATLEILIPELNGNAEEICNINYKKPGSTDNVMDSNNIFDEIKITDPRVAEFCTRTTEPSPYSMLLTCLRRNFGTVDIDTDYNVSQRHNKYNQFTMTVGKHTVTVNCRNKKEGKQKAAQAILQGLHPQLKTWGSLVRMYGNKSVKNAKEKKMEEQEITQLQTQAKINSPNYAILNKLNEELQKLYEKKMQMKPVGKLVTTDVPTNSGVNLNPLNYS